MDWTTCPNCNKALSYADIDFHCQEIMSFGKKWPAEIAVTRIEKRKCSCGLTLIFQETKTAQVPKNN